ncbi:metallophosphoesterase [Chromobacterium sp. ASV23]|uniref:metallophosphoesterase n=1 Tax=Chromobacterium sp. ASV23 TaxID=2795110 RepID=UPI0018EA4492|nr:metallophosphoesterase [Chromobacterium sp. ASV23]
MKIAQLTDIHLFASPQGRLMGVDTYAALRKVLASVQEQHADAVFLTGDISQDESEASYRLCAEALAGLGLPVHWIAGNHDKPATTARVFAEYDFMHPLDTLRLGGWTFLGVDCCVAGHDEGRIDDAGLAALRSRLARVDDGPAAVVLHHHPLAVGTPLLDDCMLMDGGRLWAMLAQAERARLAICGHVHGDHRIVRDGRVLEVCPATCFQWIKGTREAAIENRQGYRLFRFLRDHYEAKTLFL